MLDFFERTNDQAIHHGVLHEDFDVQVTNVVFDKETTNGLTLVRKALGCRWHNAYNNPRNKRERGYRDSGLWGWHRENGRLFIRVQVGCACARDCCGHMCGLRYEILQTDEFFVVITTKHFNY